MLISSGRVDESGSCIENRLESIQLSHRKTVHRRTALVVIVGAATNDCSTAWSSNLPADAPDQAEHCKACRHHPGNVHPHGKVRVDVDAQTRTEETGVMTLLPTMNGVDGS